MEQTTNDTNKTKEVINEKSPESSIKCPKCGSVNIHVDKRGFRASDACCGAILCGPLGLLCGQTGANNLVKTCLNCNKTWR